jgi:hypothetical protein
MLQLLGLSHFHQLLIVQVSKVYVIADTRFRKMIVVVVLLKHGSADSRYTT